MAVVERVLTDKLHVAESRFTEGDDGREEASKTHEDVEKADADTTQ